MISVFYLIIFVSTFSHYFILVPFALLFYLKSLNFFCTINFSVSFSLMTFFVFLFVLVSSGGSIDNLFLKFSFLFSFILFNSLDYITFFIYFELSLIFMVIYIIYFGSSYNSISSSIMMMFFTILFSIVFIFGLLLLYSNLGSLLFSITFYCCDYSLLVSILLSVVLLVKFPLLFVHFWLPKAHVDSPTYGSMYLAGVMLKMGGYGMLIMMNQIIWNFYIGMFLFWWSSLSSILIMGFCMVVLDIKSVIAFSSVAHMSFSMLGIALVSELGVFSSLIIMIYHGLVSPFMFWSVGNFYKYSKSRNISLSWGLYSISNFSSVMFMISLLLSIGFPPLIGFLGELLLIGSILPNNWFYMVFLLKLFNMLGVYMMFTNSKYNFKSDSDLILIDKEFCFSDSLVFLVIVINIFAISFFVWVI